MKLKVKRGNVLKIILICLCAVGIAVLAASSLRLLPGAVSYTIKAGKKEQNVFFASSEETGVQCLYENLYEIPNDGPFTISGKDDNIYVFRQDQILYRIKANLSDFPKTDRDAIKSQITARDRFELYEIVSYMES